MWPEYVSNPGPLTYESGALPTALRGPAHTRGTKLKKYNDCAYHVKPPSYIPERNKNFEMIRIWNH